MWTSKGWGSLASDCLQGCTTAKMQTPTCLNWSRATAQSIREHSTYVSYHSHSLGGQRQLLQAVPRQAVLPPSPEATANRAQPAKETGLMWAKRACPRSAGLSQSKLLQQLCTTADKGHLLQEELSLARCTQKTNQLLISERLNAVSHFGDREGDFWRDCQKSFRVAQNNYSAEPSLSLQRLLEPQQYQAAASYLTAKSFTACTLEGPEVSSIGKIGLLTTPPHKYQTGPRTAVWL